MGERKPVDMVRIEREEEVYEREEIFGRDVTAVFPTQAKGSDHLEALKEAIGAKKFISESELAELKASRGLSVEDGTIAADKPLAEVLRERKEAKDAEFQEKWRQMKQGKNRPLTDEELEFFDNLYEHERQQLQKQHEEEAEALDAYRAAVQMAAASKSMPEGLDILSTSGAAGQGSSREAKEAAAGSKAGPGAAAAAAAGAAAKGGAAKRPGLKAVVKVKPKAGNSSQQEQQQQQPAEGGSDPTKSEPAAKKRKVADEGAEGQEKEQEVLAGLLGDYASGSSEDGDA